MNFIRYSQTSRSLLTMQQLGRATIQNQSTPYLTSIRCYHDPYDKINRSNTCRRERRTFLAKITHWSSEADFTDWSPTADAVGGCSKSEGVSSGGTHLYLDWKRYGDPIQKTSKE